MPTWPNRSPEFYLAALSDPDSRVRRQACAALEVLREPRAVEPLLTLLASDENTDVRANAARALGKLGDARAPLIQALRDPTTNVRTNAILALEHLGDRSVTSAIVPLLADPEPIVRYHATRVVGRFGGANEVAPLMARLRANTDPEDPVLTAALAQIGVPALEPLIEALGDERPLVRASAAQALGSIKSKRAFAALTAAADDPDPYARMRVDMAIQQHRQRRLLARAERLKAEGKLGIWNILDFLAHRDEYENDEDGEDGEEE